MANVVSGENDVKILELRPLRGPNIYTRRPVIYMKLDIGSYEGKPTNKIPGFLDRLKERMPSLYEHRCSEDGPGGFFHRVALGTWFGHVTEHVALELQTLAEMDTGFGRTRQTRQGGVYNIIFSYVWEQCGKRAGELAVEFTRAVAENRSFAMDAAILELKELRERYMLGPTTASIVEEAADRGIPYLRLNDLSLVQLGYGIYQQRIEASVASTTSQIAVDIACDKDACKNLLEDAGIPVPEGTLVYDTEEASEYLASFRPPYPLVVKPFNLSKGRGATIGTKNKRETLKAVRHALRYASPVIIERFLAGQDYRLLVVNYKLIAAACRVPAKVTGDGTSTIAELVERVNRDHRRGFGHERTLTRIVIDKMTLDILAQRDMTPDSVPQKGDEVFLKSTANLSTGGTAANVTDLVHPVNRYFAEQAARVLNLDIAGVDIIAPGIDTPINENGGGICEINAAPGFRMHLSPTEGDPIPVAKPVMDMIFPPGKGARIPIVAVTGSNGKTTTVRLIAHLFRNNGHNVGYTTTDGIYVGNRLIMQGDMTGPYSAKVVLRDPTVDFAVLETARGGILREGLGFDYCDVAVVTNVSEDHLGLKDVETLEELAFAKSVVPENVGYNGHCVLNAKDPLVAKMAEKARGQVVYFSLDPNNTIYRRHCRGGGTGATVINGKLTIRRGTLRLPIADIYDIPVSFNGKAVFNVENCLAAALAAYVKGMSIDSIRAGLLTFTPTFAYMPGRTNVIKVDNFQVLLDFCHNVAAYEAMAAFTCQLRAGKRIAVMGIPGDRRDKDILRMAHIAAESFDRIFIREDLLRGRKPGEVPGMIRDAILQKRGNADGVEIVLKEEKAVVKALSAASKNDLVVIFADEVEADYKTVMKMKKVIESP